MVCVVAGRRAENQETRLQQKVPRRKRAASIQAYKKKYAQDNAEKVAKLGLDKRRRQRGIVIGERTPERLLAEQQGRCAVCDEMLPMKGAALDHDHFAPASWSSNTRGMLHSICNAALGYLGEKHGNNVLAANLRRAANHVERGAGDLDYVWDDR